MLQLAQGKELDIDIIKPYLELLRRRTYSMDILDIHHLQEQTIDLGEKGLLQPAIIPIKDQTGWAFAVAYPDCIHWYDSRPHSPTPRVTAAGNRVLVTNWTGPKHADSAESGVLMLLGIRRIHQGSAHVGQNNSEVIRPHFRTRVLVELLCGTLSPSNAEFAHILRHEEEIYSEFFLDAMHGINPTPQPEPEPGPETEPEPGPEMDSPSTSMTKIRKDRKMILENLGDAILACRSVMKSSQPQLFMLLPLVRKRGTFSQRYHAALLCDMVLGKEDASILNAADIHPDDILRIRDMARRRKFWKELCDLGQEQEIGRYTILLAVPRNTSVWIKAEERTQLYDQLRGRLYDKSDHLRGLLLRASKICSTVIDDSIPKRLMAIDYYNYGEAVKRHGITPTSFYEQCMSTESVASGRDLADGGLYENQAGGESPRYADSAR
ncbi:hypothetical protein B0I35DRAFT_365112 [Stachybotrys elegans]|uniref:Uncharacterized protein n=1 Tax=Stachybotrys elegans TaxID=80388 RepID=A0A8K0SGD6_9HYPO|nr:hypothetical protein B0I35DRAFT_365112 [Stachybotrys elegans]